VCGYFAAAAVIGSTQGRSIVSGCRTIRTLAVAVLVAIGVAGCEPPPPRLQLTVDSPLAGVDDEPGDGVCSSAAAGGTCTLQAAIDEGNAAPDGADLTVPAGHYRNADATITGDVAVNPGRPANVAITDTTITVAAGARMAVSGINTSTSIQAEPPSLPDNPGTAVALLGLEVAGSAEVGGSVLSRLDVAAGGGAVVVDSIVESVGMTNHGRLLALRSSLFGPSAYGPAATVLTTGAAGVSHLASSVVAVPHATVLISPSTSGFSYPGGQGTCAGPAPISGSYQFVEVPCGPMEGTGDGSGDAGATTTATFVYTGVGYRQVGDVHDLAPTSPLVDAIPVGDGACDAGAVDVYGRPRGVDGNGDGVGGCDIGAVERQP
jgi:hypothetical protein